MPEKFFLLSRTIVGTIVALLPQLVSLYGTEIQGADLDIIGNTGDAVLTLIGSVIVIWARFASPSAPALTLVPKA